MCGGGGGGGYRVTNNEMTVHALDSKLIGVCLTGLIGRIAHLASRRTRATIGRRPQEALSRNQQTSVSLNQVRQGSMP